MAKRSGSCWLISCLNADGNLVFMIHAAPLMAAVSYFFSARLSLIHASSYATAFDAVQLRHVTGQGGFDRASAGANMLIHMQIILIYLRVSWGKRHLRNQTSFDVWRRGIPKRRPGYPVCVLDFAGGDGVRGVVDKREGGGRGEGEKGRSIYLLEATSTDASVTIDSQKEALVRFLWTGFLQWYPIDRARSTFALAESWYKFSTCISPAQSKPSRGIFIIYCQVIMKRI
ncbi:hypothetical protein I7I51_01834 [Histoplasma capsulatum]|uniref:Uncharacterized protein n=1 Tax=Ajellomyces capsulatus TaxID=5037 RepID=A0A8A1MJM0_AJECA|nr:predicted protein [Histoplasma mississippiense (nom. inval.)]EDN02220.1 predicted protein [Histoplasma mississippiense (nom. inval.)]QSS64762.1 hypothetical protein I7I51_01834 [Histoplasma capsulatum]